MGTAYLVHEVENPMFAPTIPEAGDAGGIEGLPHVLNRSCEGHYHSLPSWGVRRIFYSKNKQTNPERPSVAQGEQ